MTTDTLFDLAPLAVVEYEPNATIAERFTAFHDANGWVLTALEDLTRDWLAHGHHKVGIGALVEVVRWQYGRATQGDPFRINNDFWSRYSRLIVQRHPEWADVFETRSLRAA